MPDTQTNTTHIEVPAKPQPTLLTETNAFMGLVISLAALLTILYKLFGFGRDVEDLKKRAVEYATTKDLAAVAEAAKSNKDRIAVLEQADNGKEVRLVELEKDVAHIRETIDRSETKLDRIMDILTMGKK